MLKAGRHSARVRFRSTELPYPSSLIPRPPPSFRQKLLAHLRLVFIPLSSPSRHPVHCVLTRARMCPCMPCGPPVNPLHIRSTHSTHERSVSVRRRTLSLSRIRSRAAHPMESGSFKYSSQFHEYAGQTVPRRRCNRPTADGRAVATQCGSFLAGPARALGGHVPLAAADQRAGACGCPSLTPWAPLRPRCRLCARVSTGAMLLEWAATRCAAARQRSTGQHEREYSRMGQGTPRAWQSAAPLLPCAARALVRRWAAWVRLALLDR